MLFMLMCSIVSAKVAFHVLLFIQITHWLLFSIHWYSITNLTLNHKDKRDRDRGQEFVDIRGPGQ